MRDVDLKIPKEELLFVKPDVRMKLYAHLLNEFKTRYPELKLVYNSLLWGDINKDVATSTVYYNKITGMPLTGDRIADTANAQGQNPMVAQKTIKYPATHQDIGVDYCVIFASPYEHMMYFTLPYIHTVSSIPGYRYCVREKQLDLWFEITMEGMGWMKEQVFAEFIDEVLDLSMDKDSPKYWKKPQYKANVISRLVNIQLQQPKK